MNAFVEAKVFQAKPSNFKKKLALAGFVAGGIAFALGVADMMGVFRLPNAEFYFGGGLVAIIFAVRFWNMQVRNGPTAVRFAADGITVSDNASKDTIPWADLKSVTYKVWRGGHFWEFKRRNREDTVDFYVDGLSSAQLDEMRETVSSINLPGVEVHVEPVYNPLGFQLSST
jgi:hypothetical protein